MKNYSRHIYLLVVLVLMSLILAYTDSENSPQKIEKNIFQVSDTSSIHGLTILKDELIVDLQKNENGWKLNDSLKVDPSLIKIFLSLISQIEVERPVSRLDIDEIRNELANDGASIEVSAQNSLSFLAGGSKDKSKSYFATKDLEEIYIVRVPGYDNYVVGLFELTLNQWRDRQLFNSTWRSIQSLEIKYGQNEIDDFKIEYAQDFLRVEGISKMDTSSVMKYISQFENFQHNDFLDPGQFPRYDSLKMLEPIATISLKDINPSKSIALNVYPKIPDERFFLLSDDQNSMIVIDERRMNSLLARQSDFIEVD